MADQPINDKDNIKNVVPSKWTKGACPPQWVDIHYSFMDGSDYTFQDGSDYDFN